MDTRNEAVALAFVLATGCAPSAGEVPGYPLYSNTQVRLPADRIAHLAGTCTGAECIPPIKLIDGQDVSSYGSAFDLLPGCHVVALDTNVVAGNVYVSWHGSSAPVVFALRMKAGDRYVIQRDIVENMGQEGRLVTTAREEDARGASTPIEPVKIADEIGACRAWQPSARQP